MIQMKWLLRRTFIYFCKEIVTLMPRDFFKEHFMRGYLETSADKVPHVRQEFSVASLIIRPYFVHDVDLSLEMMERVSKLCQDPDQDAAEAAEQADYGLT